MPEELIHAAKPIFSKVSTNFFIVLCSPPIPGMPENTFVRQFNGGVDDVRGSPPLLSRVAFTLCAACALAMRAGGVEDTIDGCGHLPQNRFPWMAVDDSTREETELRIAVGGQGLRTLSPLVVEEMFRGHPRATAIDDSMVIAVDPGGGASLTAAMAGVLTGQGVDVLGMFRSTDAEQQALQFRDFVMGMARQYGEYTLYIYIEKNLAVVVGRLVSELSRAIRDNGMETRILMLREPGSLGVGVGLTTTARSKNWIGRMFYDWMTAGWFRVVDGAEMAAYVQGGDIVAARERIAAEFADHTQHVVFGDTSIQYKQGGNDDWVIAAGLLLHGFLCASRSLRGYYTRIVPGTERPFRLDSVILLPNMLMHYAPQLAYELPREGGAGVRQ